MIFVWLHKPTHNEEYDLIKNTNLIDSPMSKSKLTARPKSRTATVVISLRKSMRRNKKSITKNHHKAPELEVNQLNLDEKKTSQQLIQLKPSSLNFLSNPSQSFIDELELSESVKKLKMLNSSENKVGLIDSSRNKQLTSLTTQLKKAKILAENNLEQQQQQESVLTDSANESVAQRERRDSGVGGSLTREIT